MIRTHVFTCTLPKAAADALNHESGRVYTGTLVRHYRIYRKSKQWLSMYAGMRVEDGVGGPTILHAHSRDAAQEGFYKACKTATALKRAGFIEARYPRRRKWFRTSIWKKAGIRVKDRALVLARARGLAPVRAALPAPLATLPAASFSEVRLVWDKAARHYAWHVVVDDGVVPTPATATGVAGVDLGEIVRHEVACVIVRRKDRTGCPIICTLRGTAFRQRDVECPRTMDPQPQGWHANREGRVHLRASMGKGTRVDGMASISEPLISIVTRYEAKDADRLRLQRVRGLISPTSWAPNAVGVERAPNPILLHMRNVVSPSGSLWESDSQEKPIDRWVWDGGESESRPVIGRIGVVR